MTAGQRNRIEALGRSIPVILIASRDEEWDEDNNEVWTMFRLKVGDFLICEQRQEYTDLDDDDLQQWVADVLKGAILK